MTLIEQIMFGLITTLLGVCAYFLKEYLKRLDEHIVSCAAKNSEVDKSTAATQERLNSLTWEIQHLRTLMHWVGDCLMTLGTKADARLPQRPSTE